MFALDAKKNVRVLGFTNEIGTLNVGFADHSSHADPLVCADGCDKERVCVFQYILGMEYLCKWFVCSVAR